MWDKILTQFNETLEKAEATYLAKAKSASHSPNLRYQDEGMLMSCGWGAGFNCTDEENVSALTVLRRRSWLALRAKVDEQTADTVLVSKLRAAFEEKFRYDEQGVPRVWKPEDDIDEAFRKAKDEVRRASRPPIPSFRPVFVMSG